MSRTIAALYVDPCGVYADVDGVELWDEERDARTYAGPHPVVAHPPCKRWCRLAGLVEARWGHRKGEDGGCFAAALEAVRTWGGVLEHPAYSAAWAAFGLPRPDRRGGWQLGLDGGASCHVEQGRYGHPAKKATWLCVHCRDTARSWRCPTCGDYPPAICQGCHNELAHGYVPTDTLHIVGRDDTLSTPDNDLDAFAPAVLAQGDDQ